MLVSFESMEGWLFFSVYQLNIFGQIWDSFLELLSFLLELFNLLIGVACFILEFYGIIFFIVDVFFEIVAAIFKVEQMLREIFVLVVLHGQSLGRSETLVDKGLDIASPRIRKDLLDGIFGINLNFGIVEVEFGFNRYFWWRLALHSKRRILYVIEEFIIFDIVEASLYF